MFRGASQALILSQSLEKMYPGKSYKPSKGPDSNLLTASCYNTLYIYIERFMSSSSDNHYPVIGLDFSWMQYIHLLC